MTVKNVTRAEAAWTFHSKVIQSIGAGDRPMQSAITEENRCGCACH
jgi:hypothetical protein